MEVAWQIIQQIAGQTNGCITTSLAAANGISRTTLSALVSKGKIVRIRRGIYSLTDTLTDDYALLQSRCTKAVFSLGTALYFWGLSDRVPHQIDITVPQGTNLTHIRASVENLRCHYVKPDTHSLGITTIKSPLGNDIRLYEKERCICDLILSGKAADKQLYIQAIKGYFSVNPNTRKLLKYSKILGVESQVRAYMEVLL